MGSGLVISKVFFYSPPACPQAIPPTTSLKEYVDFCDPEPKTELLGPVWDLSASFSIYHPFPSNHKGIRLGIKQWQKPQKVQKLKET